MTTPRSESHAELIAELREDAHWYGRPGAGAFGKRLAAAADALEAADTLLASVDVHEVELLRAEKAALAAVIEQAKARVGHDFGCATFDRDPAGECDCTVRIFDEADTDAALREHDARLLESLNHEMRENGHPFAGARYIVHQRIASIREEANRG